MTLILARGSCRWSEDRGLRFVCRAAALFEQKRGYAATKPLSSVLSPQSSGHGFTLIELLVVLVVIGVALGLVMVQLMPDQQQPLRVESSRLALLLENAGMEARASGRSLAWSGEKNQYRFLSKNKFGDWVRIDDGSEFRPRTLHEGVFISDVTVEGQAIKQGEYITLHAHTFAVPFRIRLGSGSGKALIGASVNGKSTGDVIFSLDEKMTENEIYIR